MKYTENQYMKWFVPNEGEDTSYIQLYKRSFIKTRKQHICWLCMGAIINEVLFEAEERNPPPIAIHPIGSYMLKEDCLFDGKWHHSYTCTTCMDVWLENLGIHVDDF